MISLRTVSRGPVLAVATLGCMIVLAVWASDAVAYPPGDGPNMQECVAAPASAAAAGSSAWTFLLVAAVIAAAAVLSTLTVLRTSGRIVAATSRPAYGIEVFASD